MEMGTEKSQPQREKDGLPVTLQALRDRAGLGLSDGATSELCEFFAESKFSGDPDRDTAVAMVALDTIVRDPSMLDACTCFGEGQVDTAVGAARLVLGERNVESLCEIQGENDLEQMAKKCKELSKNRDIKAGCMAARHLWGMCNTALRTFPTALFRNGSFDGFQAALLAASSRHLGVFNPDEGDLSADFLEMVTRAERIAELGGSGERHGEPKTEKEAAEVIMCLVKEGKFSELRDSSLIDMVSASGAPSPKASKLLGLRRSASKSTQRAKEGGDWVGESALAGNGAFFAGRTYEEVKSRYPGYPGHSTETSYWDSCSRHPATHGICCRLYGKVPLLTRVGGVEEGLSRAVTNKLVHHNTKFSRLSLWVKLSSGKGFWVHRTRPINWASHGVSAPPFGVGAGQMELFAEKTAQKQKTRKGVEEVTVTGYELKAMNYSHMPWVNKAISQYVEEAPFISSPTDEHQACLSVLSKALREGGSPYREALEKAADVYSLLPGRGRSAALALSSLITEETSRGEMAGDCEASLATGLRRGEIIPRRENPVVGAGETEVFSRALRLVNESLNKGADLIEGFGISPALANKAVSTLAGQYPVRGEEDMAAVRGTLGKLGDKLSDRDLAVVSREVTGLAGRCTKAALILGEAESEEIAKLVGGVLGTGVVERGKVLSPEAGEQSEAVSNYINRAVALCGARGLTSSQSEQAAILILSEAVDVAAEVEIRLAQAGATLVDKDREILFAYCAKHAKGTPLSQQDMHNRIASYGGGLTVSLDAPVGEDGKDDLYSVFTPSGDHDSEEESFGGGEIPHWLDVEKGKEGDSGKPGFMSDGGDEFFSSFGLDTMAEDLYRVVSTKGDAEQKALLENFAALNVEGVGGRAGSLGAKEQISAMLDLLDREEELSRDDTATRRKALTWIFHSVLNSVGMDREGFEKLGAAGGAATKEILFSKIRRFGMPGVLVRDGEPEPTAELGAELDKLKAWGYSRVGIRLPSSSAGEFDSWARGGGAVPLIAGIMHLGEETVGKIKAVVESEKDTGIKLAASSLMGGSGSSTDEGSKYLNARGGAEKPILEAIRKADTMVYNRVATLRMAADRGMAVDFLGVGGAVDCADAARLDSVLMVTPAASADIARRLGDFGVSSCVIKGGVDGVVRMHPDYQILPDEGGPSKESHLRNSRIPLPRRLVLAAISSHEAGVKE